MKQAKIYLQECADCAIKLSDFDTDLNVRAKVYFIELTQDFQVELNWATGYDNATDEEVIETANFSILDFEELGGFHNLFMKQLDELDKVVYDHEYDSRQAEIEFREEMRYESQDEFFERNWQENKNSYMGPDFNSWSTSN